MERWLPCRARSVCALADAKAILLTCPERSSLQHWDLKSAAAESLHDTRPNEDHFNLRIPRQRRVCCVEPGQRMSLFNSVAAKQASGMLAARQ
jgi:hypothetical protein